MLEKLSPDIEVLSKDYVLVQAWKKTSSYVRNHNWYADTLELDRTAANLPAFLRDLASAIRDPESWRSSPLRMVPAPKSQRWHIDPKSARWEPADRDKTASKLRPLAHVPLKDQVLATAIMMCLADQVETIQGDPKEPLTATNVGIQVVSYGNRLFCDATGSSLRHRWGSSKLYRAYYEDYRNFLRRPEIIADSVPDSPDQRIIIVHSDLRQFYDRVRPELLTSKLSALLPNSSSDSFLTLASKVLAWSWHKKDSIEVTEYARRAGITNFDSIALPQGLVASGFFANVVLIDFDSALRSSRNQEILPGIKVLDIVRYVDDLRIVVNTDRGVSLDKLQELVGDWIQRVLDQTAPGLLVSTEKTLASAYRGEERPLVRQSRKMTRIQGAVSGGFDAIGGIEILDSVQGLMRSQQRYSQKGDGESGWGLAPVPDVRDATVARFAAGRYRKTFRSLRPLLPDRFSRLEHSQPTDADDDWINGRRTRTQEELDEDARSFALGLIESWIADPANVRLLRIGLDLWPAPELLQSVLNLLRPYTQKGGGRKAPRRVAWYCLSEVFRAGATETGFVNEDESLPSNVDLEKFRELLRTEAVQLLSSRDVALPWYLRQQALLFLATSGPSQAPFSRAGSNSETKHYREVIQFLRGASDGLSSADFATTAVLVRRCFVGSSTAINLTRPGITPTRLEQLAERDPSFALELINSTPAFAESVSPRVRDDLCLNIAEGEVNSPTLAQIVLGGGAANPMRNELSLLKFSANLLRELRRAEPPPEVLTPVDVRFPSEINFDSDRDFPQLTISSSRVSPSGSLYRPPAWCDESMRWRFQLGFILRFVLSGKQDHTVIVKSLSKERTNAIYRPGLSHLYQRIHGSFNRHSAFGDDWLPISEWMEDFLSALLRWPGQRSINEHSFVDIGIEATIDRLDRRVGELEAWRGRNSGLLMLPVKAPRLVTPESIRPLRACVVQTVIPADEDFKVEDLTCSQPALRKRHRRHLSAALAAVERMLDLRETHKGLDGRLDWLILPELSVHPDDVQTHLVPFARAHKTLILAGLTYEELFIGQPLINSALWVIPVWDAAHGLQIRVRRQGKQHLAPMEQKLNLPVPLIQGFRPCQWLVGYEWTSSPQNEPLWLTSSICYDATDLSLVSDLKNRSDVFAIPALNMDVGTFDQMSLALHYHMYQMVVIANNGKYGGSNAYAPYKKPHYRQIFHLHGQPQASIAFFEVDPISDFQGRKAGSSVKDWKSPPAGI